MSVITIESVGSGSIDRVRKLLSGVEHGTYRAVSAALERAAATAKTRAGQFAAAEYTITKGDFMRNVHVKSTVRGGKGTSDVSMTIYYGGTVLPLLTFETNYSKSGNIQTRVKRAGGTTALEHAFAARPYGKTGIFERVGDERFPIEQKFGPSTGHMMQNEQVIEKMTETVEETYNKRIEHEIMRLLNGWGG